MIKGIMWKPVINQESSWEGECPPDMVANNLTPAYPTHPGMILKDEIEYRGLKQRRLAIEMGIPYRELHGILKARRPVTDDLANLFSKVLDINPEPLISLQKEYDALTSDSQKHSHKHFLKVRNAIAALF